MQGDQTIPVTESGPVGSEAGPSRVPELLAPAGDWDCARAAVENGADAIYFGLEKFNARMRAHNFTEADLPRLMEFLHRRGVKGYVAFNTLVFENEMAEAEQHLRAMISAGVDAAIVQDVGICRLIRQLSPDFPIHVSTQMTITSAGGVEFARDLGCNLVVLARECSIKEIEKIAHEGQGSSVEARGTEAAAGSSTSTLDPRHLSLPLEVFVHGALCVAYSGQCLTSEALGGRSANRGECAQACRLPYELIADGKQVPLGDRKYLLSPQDLAGLELLPELVRAGVASLKIEGRLKSPEYVANITRIYRNALDEFAPRFGVPASAGTLPDRGESPEPALAAGFGGSLPARAGTPNPRHSSLVTSHYSMQMAFSRGLHTGWLRGTNNQALVHARFGKKRGVYLGKVAEVRPASVFVDLEGPLKPGDGVVFDSGNSEEKEEGARVYDVRAEKAASRSGVRLTFGRGDINFQRIHAGDRLWKTSDPELDRRLRRSFAGAKPQFRRPLDIEVLGRAAQTLTLIARDEFGHVAQANSMLPLAKAETQPLTVDRLREQLGRLGGTPFRLGELTSHLEGAVLLPLAELNRLRREVVREIERLRAQPKRWSLKQSSSRREEALIKSVPPRDGARREQSLHTSAATKPHLIVLVHNLAQLDAALHCGVQTFYCEFEDPKRYRDAVASFRNSALRTPHSALFVAPPRIFKMGEEWTLKQVRSCEADGYLVRNYDHLRFFANDRRIGDFSLNVANRLAAEYFRDRFGLERLTASYDLNFMQLAALLRAAPPEWFEVTIHQHIPMFHMEHCVFCAFLSKGTDYTNCGRPCDKHDVKLRDRVGAEHPIKADVGCRNTVFNSRAQTGAEYVSRMLALGVRHFRIEFLNEPPELVTQTISKYRQLLRGEVTGPQLWRELKLLNQLGVTRGQMGMT